MYDLMHGFQSGMLKLDPCSMNKALVAKIKELNKATGLKKEIKDKSVESSYREMQVLE